MQGLTIHSSRNRFAVRLNSGVRPLKAFRVVAAPQFALPRFAHHLLLRPAFARALQVSQGGAQRFSWLCRCSNGRWHSWLAPKVCRGAAGFRRFGSSMRLAGRSLLRAHWRPNKSFKPKPLRGSVQTCCNCCRVGSLPFTLRFGLIPALGRTAIFRGICERDHSSCRRCTNWSCNGGL